MKSRSWRFVVSLWQFVYISSVSETCAKASISYYRLMDFQKPFVSIFPSASKWEKKLPIDTAFEALQYWRKSNTLWRYIFSPISSRPISVSDAVYDLYHACRVEIWMHNANHYFIQHMGSPGALFTTVYT